MLPIAGRDRASSSGRKSSRGGDPNALDFEDARDDLRGRVRFASSLKDDDARAQLPSSTPTTSSAYEPALSVFSETRLQQISFGAILGVIRFCSPLQPRRPFRNTITARLDCKCSK